MNKQFPVIYYDDSKGKKRQWKIEVRLVSQNQQLRAQIVREYGCVGGKLQKRIKPILQTKDTKKTIFEYACYLAESTWIDKAREHGHAFTQNSSAQADLNSNDYKVTNTVKRKSNSKYKAMLAHEFANHQARINISDYIAQPKLDGRRALIYKLDGKVYVCSRTGIDCIGPIDHLKMAVKDIISDDGNEVLDGEIYTTEMPRAKIVGLCNTKKRDPDTLEKSKKLCFYGFDFFDLTKLNQPFIERYQTLVSKLETCSSKNILIVPNIPINTSLDVHVNHNKFVVDGYEGIILRKKDAAYIHSRTNKLLKYKHFDEKEFVICGYHTGIDTRDGESYVVWELWYDEDNSIQFSASMKGWSLDDRKKLLQNANKYVGKLATVRYQSIMDSGVPEFGVVVELDRTDL